MRIVSFYHEGSPRLGVRLPDQRVVDLREAAPELPDTLGALLRVGDGLARAKEAAAAAPASAVRAAEEIELSVPVTDARKILCLGLNFIDHAAEGKQPVPENPVVFTRSYTSLVAHGDPLVVPKLSEQLDYEAELAVVIGRKSRHLSQDNALDAVAGYSIFNDGSVRDYQRLTPQWTIGKNFDDTGGFGPDFVTADELPAGAVGLTVRSLLNGTVMQEANTRDMIFSVAETLEFLSGIMTLEPGDVIMMGTPAGVGFARNPPVWLKPGDVSQIEIEGIGALANPVVAEA